MVKGYMDLQNCIMNRRSVRLFNNETIPIETIQELINKAVYAPSSKNRQPWRVHIYNGCEEVEKILLKNSNSCKFKNAQILISIFICCENHSNRDKDLVSIGAFIQNILLLVTDLGLSSCCLGNLILDDTFYIEKNCEYLLSIVVGKSNSHGYKTKRKYFNEISI